MSDMDDRDLIRRSVRGDEAAFELIVRRHTDAVWRVARAMLRDDHAAEDAVQETFLKAFRGLASFRGDASPKTWLVSICRRECIDRIRAKTEAPISLDRVREQHARHERPDLKVALDQIGRAHV